jgi:hypothetical protein
MSTHERHRRDEVVAGSSNRSFGLVIGGALAIFGFWAFVFRGGDIRWWLVVPAGAFVLAALILPQTLTPLNRLWTRLGLLMHRVVNPVVMAAMYYGVVTPTGLVMRALGKDLLKLRRDPAAATYWVMRDNSGSRGESMRQQF